MQERLDIPVFHDDQHGTAIVALAALRNAATLTGRTLATCARSSPAPERPGWRSRRSCSRPGIGDIAVCDRKGVLGPDRTDLTEMKQFIAAATNRAGLTGTLEAALAGADVFIGLSSGVVPESAVATMAQDCIIAAMANPNPEVDPEVAHRYAAVVATGRSDYPNQINNVLAFPGVFKGALAVRASAITEGMKLAAADAIAALVGDDLAADHVIPSVFDPRVADAVATAVAAAARLDGVARA